MAMLARPFIMTQLDFQTFADNYSSADFDKIKFNWNGEHGDKFSDTNYDFRMQLCEFLIPQLNKTKLELIRDLYLETAKSAKETWGVYNQFHLLGDELLKRGGTAYLMDYLEGSAQSMDTHIASGRLTITKEQAKQIVEFIDRKLREPLTDRERNLLGQLGKHRFEHLANK